MRLPCLVCKFSKEILLLSFLVQTTSKLLLSATEMPATPGQGQIGQCSVHQLSLAAFLHSGITHGGQSSAWPEHVTAQIQFVNTVQL